MPSDHDDRVFDVATALSTLGEIRVDLPHAYDARHSFGAKEPLPHEPRLMLAAFLPTQAVFTPKPVLPNAHWREPDVVLSSNGFRYVVDVHDDNDTFSAIARKIECIVYCARQWNVVGVAMVAKTRGARYSAKRDDLENLRKTFGCIVGADSHLADTIAPYLAALMRVPAIQEFYGRPNWDRVLELRATDTSWKEMLITHARGALASGKVMVS